jgi:quinol monooxygenase YgiN
MICRLWTTGLVKDKAIEYDEFSSSKSLAMFKKLDGCLGVLFIRSDVVGYVYSFWRDQDAIEGLKSSELYQDTVNKIIDAGFLNEFQQVEHVDITGGVLTEESIQPFIQLKS